MFLQLLNVLFALKLSNFKKIILKFFVLSIVLAWNENHFYPQNRINSYKKMSIKV